MSISWASTDLSLIVGDQLVETARLIEGETYYVVAVTKPNLSLLSCVEIPAGLFNQRPITMPDERTMNRVSAGLCSELQRRCKPIGVIDVCLKSSKANRTKGEFEMLVQFSPQMTVKGGGQSVERRVLDVQQVFRNLVADIGKYCSMATDYVLMQNAQAEPHTVFFLTERQLLKRHVREDVVEVSSHDVAKFMVMLVKHSNIWVGRQFFIGDESFHISPTAKLIQAGLQKRAPCREQQVTKNTRVTTYIPTKDGFHCLLFDGTYLGLSKSIGTAVLRPDQIFTDEFKNKAFTNIRARRLYDMGNRGVDLRYQHVYRRFAHGESKPLSVLVSEASNLQRLSEACDRNQADISSLVEENRLRQRPISF